MYRKNRKINKNVVGGIMKQIDVYDFDGTIYNGDSSIDFLVYAMKKKKSLIKYMPKTILYKFLNSLRIIEKKRFKEVYFSFIKDIKNLEKFVEEFWKIKENKINKFFLDNVKSKKEIYVISASPEFLLRPYIAKFNNVKLIGTRISNEAKLTGENCKGKEKINRLKKEEKDFVIENFYTDSIVDLPLVEISKNAYYVHDGKVEKWDEQKA